MQNNPIRFSDPTGHKCEPEDECKIKSAGALKAELLRYGVKLKDGTDKWRRRDIEAALAAVEAVAKAMGAASGLKPYEAFQAAYKTTLKDPLIFEKVTSYKFDGEKYTDGAVTVNSHLIQFATLSQPIGERTPGMAFTNVRNNIVHELGHSFARNWNSLNIDTVPDSLRNEEGWPTSPISAQATWRQHPSSMDDGVALSGEVYADMFMGWTFDTWGSGDVAADRKDFMNNSMTNFWQTYVSGNH